MRLDEVGSADPAASRLPSPHFPANLAVVRVQAPKYESESSGSYGKGAFSLVTTRELLTEEQIQALTKWSAVDEIVVLDPQLLPPKLDSLDDLRLAAAKLQADILLLYTVDTRFRLQGKAYEPLASISLGGKADAESQIESSASAVFVDVRTGYTYGEAHASARQADLGKAWSSAKLLDQERLETERQAFALLAAEAEKAWGGIAQRYR